MKKEDKILAALSKVAEIVTWSFYENYKKDEFMCILLKTRNYRTLVADDLEAINNLKPVSIMLYTDTDGSLIDESNKIYLDIEIKLN